MKSITNKSKIIKINFLVVFSIITHFFKSSSICEQKHNKERKTFPTVFHQKMILSEAFEKKISPNYFQMTRSSDEDGLSKNKADFYALNVYCGVV